MAASVFKEECTQAIKNAIDSCEELIPNLKKGVANCADICKESGAVELAKTADGVSDGVDNLISTMGELIQTLTTLLQYYQKVQRAMGNA